MKQGCSIFGIWFTCGSPPCCVTVYMTVYMFVLCIDPGTLYEELLANLSEKYMYMCLKNSWSSHPLWNVKLIVATGMKCFETNVVDNVIAKKNIYAIQSTIS